MSEVKESFNKRSIYGLVNKRLGVALILIMVMVGSGSYFLERERLLTNIEEIAYKRASQFIHQFDQLLADHHAVDTGEVQQQFDNLSYKKIEYSEGMIVNALIVDARGKTAIEYARDTKTGSENLKAYLKQNISTDKATYSHLGSKLVNLDDNKYVLIHIPIKNASGQPVGKAVLLFLVSEAKLNIIQTKVRNISLTAIAIVLVTALLMYPVIIRLIQQLSTISMELLKANLQTEKALGNAIAKRDSDTDAHNYRVTIYAVRLAEAINLDNQKMQGLIKGAFLHDVGKIGTPDHILLKPGKLTDSEFVEMQKHVAHGVDIIKSSGWLKDAEDVVLHHHEKYNGSGYSASDHTPLAGKDIPLVARIFAIVDVFDALTSHRPYKKPLSYESTMTEMEKNVGSHFDPELFKAFKIIARPLHDTLANREDELPHTQLEEIVQHYFFNDLKHLLS